MRSSAGLRFSSLSVIGFDNIPFDQVSDPPLTSVAVRNHEVGRLVVHEISEMLEGSGGQPGVALLGSELYMRESTARPESGGASQPA